MASKTSYLLIAMCGIFWVFVLGVTIMFGSEKFVYEGEVVFIR